MARAETDDSTAQLVVRYSTSLGHRPFEWSCLAVARNADQRFRVRWRSNRFRGTHSPLPHAAPCSELDLGSHGAELATVGSRVIPTRDVKSRRNEARSLYPTCSMGARDGVLGVTPGRVSRGVDPGLLKKVEARLPRFVVKTTQHRASADVEEWARVARSYS